jgi:hypothetical protein
MSIFNRWATLQYHVQDVDHAARVAAISFSTCWEGRRNHRAVFGHDAHELQLVHAGCMEWRSWALVVTTIDGCFFSIDL